MPLPCLICQEGEESSEGTEEQGQERGEEYTSSQAPPLIKNNQEPSQETTSVTSPSVSSQSEVVTLSPNSQSQEASTIPVEVSFDPATIETVVFNLSSMDSDQVSSIFESIRNTPLSSENILNAITGIDSSVQGGLNALSEGDTDKAQTIFSRVLQLTNIFQEKVLTWATSARYTLDIINALQKIIDRLSIENQPYVTQVVKSLNMLKNRVQLTRQVAQLGRNFGITFEGGITLKVLDDVINTTAPENFKQIEQRIKNRIAKRRDALTSEQAANDTLLRSFTNSLEQLRLSYNEFERLLKETRNIVVQNTL